MHLHLLADIIRARVRTMGVEEHHFVMESGALANRIFIYESNPWAPPRTCFWNRVLHH